jgi:5'-3' exonuclease
MTVCLIDADVVCYNACESRYMTADGYRIITQDEIEFTEEEDAKYLAKAWLKLQSIIKHLCELHYTDEYRAAVAGIGNYRKDLFAGYKANRHNPTKKRNPFVPQLRRMLAEHGMATEAHGMEADDQLRMWAEELRAEGVEYVICSIDKDLKMIPGRHYLIHKDEHIEMSEWDALKFYYEQLLQGDQTDAIAGAPGVGPVKAQKYLADCTTEQEMQEVVMQVYYTCFGKDLWSDALFLTGQLIYLKKHKDDWFTMDGWPRIELVDIEDKPKKKKGKKMDPWTIETALAAIDPLCIVTKQVWESALMFLAEQDDTPPHIIEAIEVVSGRDKVPSAELEAYNVMIKHFKKVPTSFMKVELPMPIVQEAPALSILDGKGTGVYPSADEPYHRKSTEDLQSAPVIPKKSIFNIPEVVVVPTFSSNWGKK